MPFSIFLHASSSVCQSACISTAATGRNFVKSHIGDFYKNLLKNSQIWLKSDKKISGTLHEDLSTFILLEALRNILYLDNRAKRTRSWVSVARLKGFFLFLTATYRSHNDTSGKRCCVSTTTVVRGTGHSITQYVHFQSRSNYEANYSLHIVTTMALTF